MNERPATAAEIIGVLGEIEPLTLDRLLATGATASEVANAVLAIEDEDSFGEAHHSPSSPREAEVRAILEEEVFDDIDERESEGDIAHT
jgi:hypothetical protein